MDRRCFSIVGAIVLTVLGVPAVARAEGDDQRLFAEGASLFEKGEHRAALAKFQAVYATTPKPIVLFNLALTHEALGDPVRAIDAWERLLAAPGKLKEARLARAREGLATQRKLVGTVTVTCAAPNATLSLTGEKAPRAVGKAVTVKAGTVEIFVEAEGHKGERRSVEVKAGADTALQVELTSLAEPAQLSVKSRLVDAEVRVDGVVVGRTPLLASIAIEAGQHRVELRREGYATAGDSVVLAARGSAELSLDPKVDPDAARAGGAALLARTDPEDASIFVDGERIEMPAQGAALPPGRHRLELTRSGFDPLVAEIELAKGQRLTRSFALLPTPEERASRRGTAESMRAGAIAGFVIGGALIPTGIGLLVWNRPEQEEIRAQIAADSCRDVPVEAQTRCYQELDHRSVQANGIDYAASIGIGLGVAGAVTGAVLLALGDAPSKWDLPAIEEWAVLPAVAPGHYALALRGAF